MLYGILLTLLIGPFSTSPGIAGIPAPGESCTARVFLDKIDPKATQDSPEHDLDAFNQGAVLVPGGVPHITVQDQGCQEVCWSYATNAYADSLSLAKTGKEVISSQAHSGIWHIYFQLQTHLDYFKTLQNQVRSGKKTEHQAIIEAVRLIKKHRKGETAASALFVPSPGSVEATALQEASVVGFVPKNLYQLTVTPQQEKWFEQTALPQLVKQFMLDPAKLQSFAATDADGINTPLYNALTETLKPYTGDIHLYRPNETFTDQGQQFTPKTFMTQGLQFDPTAYKMVTITKATHALAMQAITEALNTGHPIPIGFPVFQDAIDSKTNAVIAAEKTGIFALQYCPGGSCTQIAGGHEVMIVNAKKSSDGSESFLGAIAQNSWGLTGLDVNGAKPTTPATSGFYGITSDYLANLFKVRVTYDIVLPNSILNDPKYAALIAH